MKKTQYFCDGCDIELGTVLKCIDRSVTISDGDHQLLGGTYDLCESCERQLFERSDPTKWPRQAR